MLLLIQFDPETAEASGAIRRLGARLGTVMEFELRLLLLFMPADETIVLPPTYWLEWELCAAILSRHMVFVEDGFIKFLMDERTFEDFKDKKEWRYRFLFHIARFKKAYKDRGLRGLDAVPGLVLPKGFQAGLRSYENFRSRAYVALHKVFLSRGEIDSFLKRLDATQQEVFLWESVSEELKARGKDPASSDKSSGLRVQMDMTYLEAHAAAGVIIPRNSDVAQNLIIPARWAKWSDIHTLRRVLAALDLDDLVRNSSAADVRKFSRVPEWQDAAERVRNSVEQGASLQHLIAELRMRKIESVLKATIRKSSRKSADAVWYRWNAFGASVAFLLIPDLFRDDAIRGYHAITHLHRVLREASSRAPGLRVFSSLVGAIVVAPDTTGIVLHDVLRALLSRASAADIPLRVGVTHGHVSALEDFDGEVTPIGRTVNVAARLAGARTVKHPDAPTEMPNDGCLFHESYADYAFQAATTHGGNAAWMTPSARNGHLRSVKGKRDEVFRAVAAPTGEFLTSPPTRYEHLPEATIDESARWGGAVALAYDLPGFSDGDTLRLRSRFDDVVGVVSRELSLSEPARLAFSPGGDGGIIVLPDIHQDRAYEIAAKVAKSLQIETSVKTADAGTESRVGLNYGSVLLYEDAEGRLRPTGPTVFVADELSGDEVGRSNAGPIFSHAFAESAAHGDDTTFGREFRWLSALHSATGLDVKRFVRR